MHISKEKAAHEAFSKVFKGCPNFITPMVEFRDSNGTFAWELSSGQGFGEGKVFCVTVLNISDGVPNNESGLCKYFDSRKEALAYIDEIKAQS